ncbi:hypothetical protein BMS3Abin03_00516 [bacterium BMS3Abin03]|nr:hypothetical protein BMS3Abin03_00516 [bacterium BMS3Abin03]
MLLETRNVKKNDFIIYSRNSTDEEYNFRIIFRGDPELNHRKISFKRVKMLINEYFPKNIIVYRLLTNIPELILHNTDHGFLAYVNQEYELLFTDPVYAVRTIESLLDIDIYESFRFRIQQVGLTAIKKYNGEANYIERVSYDLKANEAITQNDQNLVEELFDLNKNIQKIETKVENESYIFIPESLKDPIGMGGESSLISKDNIIERVEGASRMARITADDTMFEGKKLPLEFPKRENPDEKVIPKSSIEQLNNVDDRTSNTSSERSNQISMRGKEIKIEDLIYPEKEIVESRYKLSEDELSEYGEFRKVHSMPPIQIRKVQIEDDNSITVVEETIPTQGDKLFKRFLDNIKDESDTKTRRKKKRKKKSKESDIIDLFKYIQKKDVIADNKKEEIILKLDQNKKK